MGISLSIVGVVLILVSLGSCAVAKSSIHEIYAAVQFLSGVVLMASGAVLSELQGLRKDLKKPMPVFIDNPPK